jgi:glycosyltransferase involved in cell wall biosynthesis
MPLLLVDATAISQNAKGVGKYTEHLVRRAIDTLPASWSISLLVSEDIEDQLGGSSRVHFINVGGANELLKGAALVPLAALRLRPSAVIIPMDEAVYVPRAPYVVVAHDVPELIQCAESAQPSAYRKVVDDTKNRLRISALRRAAHVFCNSNFIQNEVQSRYSIPPSLTSVAYCGVDSRFYEAPKAQARAFWPELQGWRGYVLTFATGDTRESFDLCPSTWGLARDGLNGVGLVIGGIHPNAPYADRLRSEFERRGMREGSEFLFVPFLGAQEFDKLHALYHSADFYLELSGHEGFGMQLAEALACGTTCISSGRGALREVGAGFPVELADLEPAAIGAALRESYAAGLHHRDKTDQVAMTRRFDWALTGDAVMGEVLRLAEVGRR